MKVKYSDDKKNIIITVPVAKDPPDSKSGKTRILATSGGNQTTDLKFENESVVVGLNVYVKK